MAFVKYWLDDRKFRFVDWREATERYHEAEGFDIHIRCDGLKGSISCNDEFLCWGEEHLVGQAIASYTSDGYYLISAQTNHDAMMIKLRWG